MTRRVFLTMSVLTALTVLGGCTTVGVMPGMTMSSPVPERRAGTEVQFAGVPSFFLSDAAQNTSFGSMAPQLAGWLDLAELIEPVDGLGPNRRPPIGESARNRVASARFEELRRATSTARPRTRFARAEA